MKPTVKFIGENGNIFNLISIATKALKNKGLTQEATKMRNKVFDNAKNYNEALKTIGEYVEIE